MSDKDEKTVIKPDTTEYTKAKAASGAKSLHNGDSVACALEGATLEECIKLGAEALDCSQKELREKYEHLNIGQQRMNVGNRIRGAVNKMNKEEEGKGDKWIEGAAEPIRAAVAKRAEKAQAEAEKKAAAKAKEAEKKAKKAA